VEDNKIMQITSDIELLNDGEAFASVSLNPLYQWAKLVVCDSDPNGNNEQIEEAEFGNLIKTGINAPVKMAERNISNGHAEAFGHPIGVISQLKQEGNKLLALAALWKKERPDDIALLKDMYTKGNPPNVSWEISYAGSETLDGIKKFKGCVLNGLAVVNLPAYQGRTPFVAMSSLEVEEVTAELGEASIWTRAYIDDLPDSAFLFVEDGGKLGTDGKTEPRSKRLFPYIDKNGNKDVAHLNNSIARLAESELNENVKNKLVRKATKLLQETNSSTEENTQTMEELEKVTSELEKANALIVEKDNLLKEKETEFSTQLASLQDELKPLKEFKEQIDAEKEKVKKLASIKTKFKEAGLDKDDTYFEDKKEALLKMQVEELDFMLQELVGFAQSTESSASVRVPFVTGVTPIEREEIIKALRDRKAKTI
jgi:hypothetical protein